MFDALMDKLDEQEKRIKELEQINEEHRKINGELRKTINEAVDYIENDMPYLEEPDDDYENNHKMIEYDNSVLLNILQNGEENERRNME